VARRIARRIAGYFLLSVTVAIGLTLAPVLYLRWVDPPVSAFMLSYLLEREQDAPFDYQWVSLNDISPAMPIAVIAAEDQRFAMHYGLDFDAIAQAWEEKRGGKRLRGASTLSQQLAKNMFLWSDKNYLRKALEAYLTLLLEGVLSKERILELYLNVAEFGPGIYGVEAAAQHFFSIPAVALSKQQACLLAATLPNPKQLSASAPTDYLRRRQQWICRQTRQLGGENYLQLLAE
jgi:monofunctional biosynthetic peptidoglycan transglycosylase